MENLYMVVESGGKYYCNPNCYFERPRKVGEMINGDKIVMVGSIEECREFVQENSIEHETFYDLLK